jgi:hypothetical protein
MPAVEREGVPGAGRLDRCGMAENVREQFAAEEVGAAVVVVAAEVDREHALGSGVRLEMRQ